MTVSVYLREYMKIFTRTHRQQKADREIVEESLFQLYWKVLKNNYPIIIHTEVVNNISNYDTFT